MNLLRGLGKAIGWMYQRLGARLTFAIIGSIVITLVLSIWVFAYATYTVIENHRPGGKPTQQEQERR